MTKFWATLSNDILNILTNGLEEFNVVIEVGEAPNTQTFHAHSIILRARSPYFRQALSKNWARKERDVIKFTKPNISPKDTLEDVMRYHLKPTTSPKPVDNLAKRLQFDSGLLRQSHAALLCSWIDRLGQKRGMIEDGRLCRVSRHRSCYAIRFNGRDYGPCFGDKDLSMKGKFDQEGSCSCQKDDYFDKVTDTGSFKVDEYEVFKIVKK
ncbi:6948_t:CDS:2 [Funneliformis geosporum]|nr:6948_t:CDS:2 [Funneliformis geosporum]